MGPFRGRNRLLAKELRDANLAEKNKNSNNTNNDDKMDNDIHSNNNNNNINTVQRHQQDVITVTNVSKVLMKRTILISVLIGIISIKKNYEYFLYKLVPNGLPSMIPLQYTFMMIPPKNDTNTALLQFQHGQTSIIIESESVSESTTTKQQQQHQPLLHGPETIIINEQTDEIFVLNTDGFLVSVYDLQNKQHEQKYDNSSTANDKESFVLSAQTRIVTDLGNGRPLSGKFKFEQDGTTTLYIADAVIGLTRIRNFYNTNSTTTNSKSKVEVVVSKTPNTNQPIYFADDVVIGPVTGMVYFTDATNIPPRIIRRRRKSKNTHSNNEYKWDLLYPSIQECLRGYGTGRLLQYNPITDIVTVLATNLSFANGLSVLDANESALLVVETCRMQIHKYYLTGPKVGTMEIVISMNQLPGFVDGIDCIWSTGICYGALMNEISIIQKILKNVPLFIEPYLRTFVLWSSQFIDIPIHPFGGIIEIDTTNTQQHTQPKYTIKRFLLDPIGRDITGITGITYHKNKLYLGSLHNNYIGVYDLSS